MPEEEKASLLAEARKMAEWTVLKKARSEVYLRLDLLRADVDPSSHDKKHRVDLFAEEEEGELGGAGGGGPSTRSSLWQSFLAQFSPLEQDQFAAAASAQATEGRRTGPGGDLEWAWWAARETAGAAGKGVVKAHQESAADIVRKGSLDVQQRHHHRPTSPRPSFGDRARRRSGEFGRPGTTSTTPRKKSFDQLGGGGSARKSHESRRRSFDHGGSGSRRSSGETSRRPSLDVLLRFSSSSLGLGGGGPGDDDEGEGNATPGLAVPPPEVEQTRQSLLGKYVDGVRGYLTAARQRQVR